MKVYIQQHNQDAGKWIFGGYENAFRKMGYDVEPLLAGNMSSGSPDVNLQFPLQILLPEDLPEEYMIVANADALGSRLSRAAKNQILQKGATLLNTDEKGDRLYSPLREVDNYHNKILKFIEGSVKSFMLTGPCAYPYPWGLHPNFRCRASYKIMEGLNSIPHVHLVAFGSFVRWHYRWKKVNSVPLAFDSVAYEMKEDKKYKQFDVCFVGGWANNGFDEKRQIILKTMKAFQASNLKCAFFVDKNISHEQENLLLSNSNVALNIHDQYQHVTGHDTNERTFKSLGLNGTLVSEPIGQLCELFPEIDTLSFDPKQMVKYTQDLISLEFQELQDLKNRNRENILKNHCYTHRVEQLLSLEEVSCEPFGLDLDKAQNDPPEIMETYLHGDEYSISGLQTRDIRCEDKK